MTFDNLKKLRFLHFNDCYDVNEKKDQRGDATRFLTALLSKIIDKNRTIVLFSGDILSQFFMMQTVLKGIHMATVMNLCKVECAVFGNHEFDFTLDDLSNFTKECKFPWLMSNVLHKQTNEPLANGKLYHLIERNNIKIGLIGLIEEEWLHELPAIQRDDLIYLDFVKESKKLIKILKDKYNVDLIIALTHMELKNDIRLAENVKEIDLILGAHDHAYQSHIVNNKIILKSGNEFKDFSIVDMTINLNTKKIDKIDIERIDVKSSDFEVNQELKAELDKFRQIIEKKLGHEIAFFDVDLDARFSKIQTCETNLGNFICDVVLETTKSDCVLINSGTMRSDSLHEKGSFKLRDLVAIFPASSPLIVLEITGYQLYQCLENGVSLYPKNAGRFPTVSNIRFKFDPNKKIGNRVDLNCILVGGKHLNLEKKYSLTTKLYVSEGNDNYKCLIGSKVLMSQEKCQNLITIVENYFKSKKGITLSPKIDGRVSMISN